MDEIKATGREINLAPTDEGYLNIARVFAGSILGDVRKARKDATRELLTGLLDVACYLRVNRPDMYQALIDDIKAGR